MKEKLTHILRRCLVVPLPDEQLDKLVKTCKDIVGNMDYNLADKLISFVVSDREDECLQEAVKEKIEEASPEMGNVFDVFYRACSLYIVWLAVKGDQLDDDMKAGMSLMTRNVILLRKKCQMKLPAPEMIPELYGVWDDYLEDEEPEADLDEAMKMATDVLSNTDYFSATTIDVEGAALVRKWAYDAAITMLKAKFNAGKKEYLSKESLIERMTMAVRDWVKNLPMMTLNIDGIKEITGLFALEELNQTFTIRELLDKLDEYELNLEEGVALNTSVLISALNDEGLKEELGDIKLTILEYGIYLYYELIAEKLIKE